MQVQFEVQRNIIENSLDNPKAHLLWQKCNIKDLHIIKMYLQYYYSRSSFYSYEADELNYLLPFMELNGEI